MKTLIYTYGLPGSGKTTWAIEKAKASHVKRINKDDLRAMIDGGVYSGQNEKQILHIRDTMIRDFLLKDYDVIVDDTNLDPKHSKRFNEIGKSLGAVVEIEDFTGVSVEECIKRDLKRHNSVGEKVIRQMYNKYIAPAVNTIEYKADLPYAIICDIDGTLAHMKDRSPYDESKVGHDDIDLPVLDLLGMYSITDIMQQSLQTTIILMSGRHDSCRELTEVWLKKYNVPYHQLHMRKTGDGRKDFIVKQELFDEHVRDKYNVTFVLDDRNQVVDMWRRMGLKTFQVEPGDF